MWFRILAAALFLGPLHAKLDADEEIRADRSETLLEPSGAVRIYTGGVAARFGKVYVAADTARARERARKVTFVGGVSYRDASRLLRADSLVYDSGQETAVFRGRVHVESDGKVVRAPVVTYRRRENLIRAGGGVRMAYPDGGIRIRAHSLRSYHVSADSGLAEGAVEVTRVSGLGADTLVVRSDTLRFHDGGRRMWFSGDTQVRQRGLSAVGHAARYAKGEGRLELEGEPRAAWSRKGPGRTDSVDVRAGRIAVGLEDGGVGEILLREGAEITMAVRRDSTAEVRAVRADSSDLVLLDEELVEVRAAGQVEIQVSSAGAHLTDLSGRRARFTFQSGDLDSLTLTGETAVTHVPGAGEAVSRLSGGRILIVFAEGRARRLVAEGEAACEHEDREGGDEGFRLTGDRVELIFEEEGLRGASASGGVRGSYVREREEDGRP